jgi:hypothetical protein
VRQPSRLVPNSSLGEKIDGVPFQVSLHPAGGQGRAVGARFILLAIAPGDLEGVRQTRLRLACERKFGRLGAWKRDHNARTAPVLEENDVFLTNHQLVAEALSSAEAGLSNLPDAIFLVSTSLPTSGG